MIAVVLRQHAASRRVACRYFLGHAEPGRLAQGRRARRSTASPTATRARCARVLPYRVAGHRRVPSCWSSRSVWMATRLPSTFFPEIDESMERVYVRFAPGHVARRTRRAKINGMGSAAREGAAARAPSSWCSRTSARPSNARSAMTSPNSGPAHGLHPRRAGRRRAAQARSSARSPTGCARSSNAHYPGRRVPAVAGRPGRERLLERLHRAAGRRGARRQPRASSTSSRSAVAEVARTVPGIRDIYPSLADRLPRGARRDRPRAGRRSSASRARDAAQTTLEATLGNINTPSVWIDGAQRPVVLRRHVLRRHASSTIRTRSAQIPVRIGDDGGAGDARRLRQHPPLGRADRRSSATSSQRAAHVLDADRGPRHRQRGRASSRQQAARRSAHRATSTSTSSARSS